MNKPKVDPHRRRSTSIVPPIVHAVVSLLITAALIAGKIQLEHSRFGQHIESMTFSLQQLRLADAVRGNASLPVVIDISDLKRVGRKTLNDPDDLQVTDRVALREVIRQVVSLGPAAVGVDVLLDPPAGEPLTTDESRVLETCAAARDRGNQPICFVAVHDGILRGRAALGNEAFADLAAAVVVPKPGHLLTSARMPREISVTIPHAGGADTFMLKSMPLRLAEVARRGQKQEHSFVASLARDWPSLVSEETVHRGKLIGATEFVVNYGALSALMADTIKPDERGTLSREVVKGRIVLIGRATTSTDTFNVPTQNEPVSGVYLHAAAAYTLVSDPLFELTHAGRLVADAVIALVPIVFVLAVRIARARRGTPDPRPHVLPDRLMAATAAAVFIVGFFWSVRTGIMWTDYLMVAGALLFHGPVEHPVNAVLARLHIGGAAASHSHV